MTKENDNSNIVSPFSPDLDAIMRDDHKYDQSLFHPGDKRSNGPSVTMDGGVPTDSVE